MQQIFNVVIERDPESWLVASVPSLPGRHTQARSFDELDSRIKETIELCINGGFRFILPQTSKIIATLLAITSLLGSVSCTSVSYPKASAAERELARNFTPPPGKALIVAYRNQSIAPFSSTLPTGLWIDGTPHGANKAGTFVVAPVSKGPHNIDLFCDSGADGQSFDVFVSAGDVLFFRQHVENTTAGAMLVPTGAAPVPAPVAAMKIYATRVSYAEGKRDVSQCVQLGNGGKVSVSTWP